MDLTLPPLTVPAVPAQGNGIDRKVRAALARATGTLSIASARQTAADWSMNLLVPPGKRLELAGHYILEK